VLKSKTLRVGLYARVSTHEQVTENQLRDLRQYAADRVWEIHDEYVDHGLSGAKSSRPALDRMMDDARKKRFDLIVVWRFDRFARSVKHLVLALEELRGLGVGFVSYSESIDTSSPLGQAIFTIIAAMAELERNIIIERVHAGLRRARSQGKRIGRPAGLKVDVQSVAHLMESGMSFRDAARELGVSIGTIQRAMDAYWKGVLETDLPAPMKRKTN
jgi:DNA invertase Pin-like site-specific DNA recombinase